MNIGTVQQYKSDVAFKTLVEGINDNLYFIPKYQRKFRWTQEQVQRLARSLVKGYPIPPIYAYRNGDGQLEILDGQQRLMSLYFYYIGKFIHPKEASAIDYRRLEVANKKYQEVLEENFNLIEMVTYLDEEEKQDISYQKLPVEWKRRVDYTTITVIELRWDNLENRPVDLQNIFSNLNAEGTLLSAQELRNGIYDCPFYDMLRDMNSENGNWRKIVGRESNTEDDMEFLLRLCTVQKNVEYTDGIFVIKNYHSRYSEWLDEFSEGAMKMENQEVEYYKNILEDFLGRFQLKKVLGLQKALIESLFVVIEKAFLDVTITQDMIDKILSSDSYQDNTQQGTVQKGKMNERWKGVYEILSQYVK